MEDFQNQLNSEVNKDENGEEYDPTVEIGTEVDISPDKDGKIIKTVLKRGLGKFECKIHITVITALHSFS